MNALVSPTLRALTLLSLWSTRTSLNCSARRTYFPLNRYRISPLKSIPS